MMRWLCRRRLLLPIAALLLPLAAGLNASEWKRRTIYQLLTDRFALAGEHASDTCDDPGCEYGSYCGGTFSGIVEQLDYISGMGFDAIWISPVVDNTACGYHGYWARNIFQIEERFGGAEELSKLMAACRSRGIAVMLDVVANHMGPRQPNESYSGFVPFNSTEQYHGTGGHHCDATKAAPTLDGQHQREVCWLANLADLKQEDYHVAATLIEWMRNLQQKYGFDGVRIDTVPYVNQTFWLDFQEQGLGDTYSVGEVLVADKQLSYLASYQLATGSEGYVGPLLSGILNYPLFWQIRAALMSGSDSLQHVKALYDELCATFADVGALGNFVENHDQSRWLYSNADPRSYMNGLVLTFFLPGVPTAYYGTGNAM